MNDNENSRDEIEEPDTAQGQEPLGPKDEESAPTEAQNLGEEDADPSTESPKPEEEGVNLSTKPQKPEEERTDPSTDVEISEEESAKIPTEPESAPKQKSSNVRQGILTAGIMISAISIIIMIALSTCLVIGLVSAIGNVAFIPVVAIPYSNDANDDSQIIAEAMESVVVVSVDTETSGGTGSGIILSANGYIVTNYHVVEGATAIYVQLYGSSSNIKAELIGYSEHDDVAVIKINKTGLRPATFLSDCSNCKAGQRVYAIGSPKGTDYSYSVTTGIISAVNRNVKIYDGSTLKKKMRMIQTDAAVNPGNSGGALINAAGQVVGIVTLKLDGVDGMGFALPSDGVLPIVNAIIENGNADGVKSTIASGRPLMGVTCVSVQKNTWYVNTDSGIAAVTDEYAEANPEAVFKSDEDGVYVKGTSEGMDAHGKLFDGDVITKIGSTRVYTAEQLISVLNNLYGGDTVTLTVYRGGEYITVNIALKEAPIE